MSERNELREELKEALAKGNVNIEEITNKMVAEEREKLTATFAEERATMEGFLQSKIEKNLSLEVAYDEIKDAYRALEASMSSDDRSLRQKVQLLERSVEQVSSMYQQAMNERSILKVELQTKDRKLQKSLERQ